MMMIYLTRHIALIERITCEEVARSVRDKIAMTFIGDIASVASKITLANVLSNVSFTLFPTLQIKDINRK
jgi:hypothetical protein